VLALALFGGLVASWAIGEAALTAIDRPTPGTLALPTGIVLLVSQVAGVVEHLARGTAHCLLGGSVLAAGIALRLWAIATLGTGFATALAPSRIVRTGPYRWMAHPSEIGLVAAVGGTAILLASQAAALALAVLIGLVAVRCRREDVQLRACRGAPDPTGPMA